MKKFSDLVKENARNKTFKYSAILKISGTVLAESEGSAGMLVDDELEYASAAVDHDLTSNATVYGQEIVLIEEVTNESAILESAGQVNIEKPLKVLNEGFESDEYLNDIVEQLTQSIGEMTQEISDDEFNYVAGKLMNFLKEGIDNRNEITNTRDNVNSNSSTEEHKSFNYDFTDILTVAGEHDYDAFGDLLQEFNVKYKTQLVSPLESDLYKLSTISETGTETLEELVQMWNNAINA